MQNSRLFKECSTTLFIQLLQFSKFTNNENVTNCPGNRSWKTITRNERNIYQLFIRLAMSWQTCLLRTTNVKLPHKTLFVWPRNKTTTERRSSGIRNTPLQRFMVNTSNW